MAPEPKAVAAVSVRRFSPHSDVFEARRRDDSRRLSVREAQPVGHGPSLRSNGGDEAPGEIPEGALDVDGELLGLQVGAVALGASWDALEAAAATLEPMPDVAPKIEYQDRIVRYPGQAYRLQLVALGVLAIVDGTSGHTLARASIDDEPFRLQGDDVETAQRVIDDWARWCRENGKELWPT